MAVCEIRWFSNVIQKQVATLVILPDSGKGPFPTYYLLHGLSDDHTIWHRRTRIEVYAAAYPMIVVMPDGFRGFYTKNNNGPDYAQYIGQELPTMIERVFPASSKPADRCIGGLSMGGYGALRIALGYPGKFVSANSHSGALMAGSRAVPPDRFPEAKNIFGHQPRGTDHDLLHLAKKAAAAKLLPKIRIDCGVEDFLIQDNRDFDAELKKMKVPHEYQEFPGAHNWDYWEIHVQEALRFHARHLKIG